MSDGRGGGFRARGNSGAAAVLQEAHWLQAIGDGDEQAFEQLFNLHSTRVLQVAYKLLGSKHEAEDVVQEVFLAVFKKATTFRGQSLLSTWLYRLTVNAALGRLRRRNRRKEVSYEDFLPQFQRDGHHQARPVVDWSLELAGRSADVEMQRVLRNAVGQLRPVDKAVLVLGDVEGLSDQEIAQCLGLTTSAVKTRLHRSRLFLREKLAAHLGYSVKNRQ
jgi:RNA polymerase sigma-70 factor (ECF subfamily)